MHTVRSLSAPYLQMLCPEDQSAYRCAFLRQDARLFAVLVGVGLLINGLLVRSDSFFLRGHTLFSWVLALRLVFALFSLTMITVMLRTGSPRSLDQWAFAWAMACVVMDMLIIPTRPASYTNHLPLDLCMVLGLYAIQAGPTLWRVMPPLLLSLYNIALLQTMKMPADPATSMAATTSFIAANAIGWIVTTNWHHYRQSSFYAHQALEQLYRTSEQQRRAAEASERSWERITDTSPNMLLVIDKQYRIKRVNKTLADCFGITKDEAIGRTCCQVLCEAEQPPAMCPHWATCTTGQPPNVETTLPSLGIDVSIVAAPLLDQTSRHEATVLIIKDITAWKRIESALKTAREQYRSLVENSHGLIYTITPDGYVTYASPSFQLLLGFAPEHFVGKHFQEVVYSEDVPLCKAFQQEVLETGQVRRSLEYRVVHHNGSLRWHLSNFIPRVDDQGRIDSFVGNTMDITELKEARAAAMAASQAKSDFLALVSHEIRTPLSAIMGFGGLARKTTDPEQLRQYIEMLDQSAHLLMDLVNDVLDMSKVEAGQLIIDAIRFNLLETLDLLHWQFTSVTAKNTRVEFHLSKADNLPAWILGDPTRFRQIVSNLLSNALKFTEVGSVLLKVQLIPADKPAESDHLLIEVHDTGIGIDKNKQAMLFQPFQQIEPGITRRYGGTGLGLTIVKRLVELMGGWIEVTTRLGQGSCFAVGLPCSICEPPQYDRLRIVRSGPLSVLVVEDNTFNRLLLQKTLQGWGHTVTSVDNAGEALERIDSHRYDCIILDVWMPGMDGLALTTQLRRLEERSGVEPTFIIAYTADTDERMRERCRAAGMQEVLFKPLDLKQLTLVMSELCHPGHAPADGFDQGGMEMKPDPLGLSQHIVADMKHDSERIASFAHLLWEDIVGEFNRLNQALLLEDRHQMQSAGHSLKGLCGYLHNQRPGIIARKLHKGAMELPFRELSTLVKHLHQVLIRPPADVDQQE